MVSVNTEIHMVDKGDNTAVTGFLYGVSLLFVVGVLAHYCQILLISPTKERSFTWDGVPIHFFMN